MRELLKNPDDTTQVFHIIEALKGDSLGAAVRRLRSSDRGRALLQKKPDIVSKLNDRGWLLSHHKEDSGDGSAQQRIGQLGDRVLMGSATRPLR